MHVRIQLNSHIEIYVPLVERASNYVKLGILVTTPPRNNSDTIFIDKKLNQA